MHRRGSVICGPSSTPLSSRPTTLGMRRSREMRGMATISAIMMGQVGEKGDGLVSESYE
jgi:hypothetical protein